MDVKSARERGHEIDGEHGAKALATRAWTDLNPDRLKYQMIFTSHDTIEFEKFKAASDFIGRGDGGRENS